MTNKSTAAPSKLGCRVKITLEGNKFNGQRGTIIAQTKSNYKIQIDGVKTAQTIPVGNAPVSRGRRPKSHVIVAA